MEQEEEEEMEEKEEMEKEEEVVVGVIAENSRKGVKWYTPYDSYALYPK